MTDYTTDPDVQLMLAFKDGDKAAFEKLMAKYYPRVLNFVYRYVQNRDVAEDLTQETFIKIYKNAHAYSVKAKFQTWAFTIAKNLSLNELRKLKRKMVSIDQTVDTGEGEVAFQLADDKAQTGAQMATKEEQAVAVREAIAALPENQRTAVLLRRYEQMSYDDIAATMGTTSKAVKSLLNRAKENLRKKLKNWI